MSNRTNAVHSDYPGWPTNQEWPSLNDWEKSLALEKTSPGQGLFGSDYTISAAMRGAPHPEYVKRWRHEHNKTVSAVASYFGPSEVQVLYACR